MEAERRMIGGVTPLESNVIDEPTPKAERDKEIIGLSKNTNSYVLEYIKYNFKNYKFVVIDSHYQFLT